MKMSIWMLVVGLSVSGGYAAADGLEGRISVWGEEGTILNFHEGPINRMFADLIHATPGYYTEDFGGYQVIGLYPEGYKPPSHSGSDGGGPMRLECYMQDGVSTFCRMGYDAGSGWAKPASMGYGIDYCVVGSGTFRVIQKSDVPWLSVEGTAAQYLFEASHGKLYSYASQSKLISKKVTKRDPGSWTTSSCVKTKSGEDAPGYQCEISLEALGLSKASE